MTRLFFVVCAMLALTSSVSFAQNQQNGWTITYAEREIITAQSASGAATAGIISQNGAYSSVALWGGNNSFGHCYVRATMLLYQGQNASPTISIKSKSRISGALEGNSAYCFSTAKGDRFTLNEFTLSAAGAYTVTKESLISTFTVQSAFDFQCESHITGNGFGDADAHGKYLFVAPAGGNPG